MQERTRPPAAPVEDAPAWSPSAPVTGAGDLDARVRHASHNQLYPVAGLTVGRVRQRMRVQLDLPPGVQAFLEGQPVSDETVIRAGEELEFAREGGDKGAAGR